MKSTYPLSREEKKYSKSLLSVSRTPIVMGLLATIFILVSPFWFLTQHGISPLHHILFLTVYILAMSAGSVGMAAWTWWPFRFVFSDCKAGQKAVETITIERLQKVGFFEMQADSALGIMAGAVYYLWLPDETRTPPHRRFRISLTTYRQLMLYGNGPIEISCLPKSGMILSIDVPGYRYAAYESPKNRHLIG